MVRKLNKSSTRREKGLKMVENRLKENFTPFMRFYAPFVAKILDNILRGEN